jgi:hypothetical protein
MAPKVHSESFIIAVLGLETKWADCDGAIEMYPRTGCGI